MNRNQVTSRGNLLMRVIRFYSDGFRSMTVGRYLWVMILIKLFILFFIFKLFFFPDILQRDYDNDADRARAVRHSMTDTGRNQGNISLIP